MTSSSSTAKPAKRISRTSSLSKTRILRSRRSKTSLSRLSKRQARTVKISGFSPLRLEYAYRSVGLSAPRTTVSRTVSDSSIRTRSLGLSRPYFAARPGFPAAAALSSTTRSISVSRKLRRYLSTAFSSAPAITGDCKRQPSGVLANEMAEAVRSMKIRVAS